MNSTPIRFIFIIGHMLALTSCANEIVRPSQDSYHLNIIDNVTKQRFDIILISDDDRPICVSNENWPNSSGIFTVENSEVFVESAAGIFSTQSPLMSAYCPGGCGFHKIAPHSELQGFILYAAFYNSVNFADDPSKKLRFSVSPSYCKD
jgi:hypothetical protein